jgi:TonB-dependent SusC/RagA subfamily outer membrane receptor
MKTLLYAFLLTTTLGCASSGSLSKVNRDIDKENQVTDSYRDLGEYLKGISGVQVTETSGSYSILVRGTVSNAGSTEPLFVVNRTPVGGYDQAAAMVDPNDIKRIEVLKDVSDTSSYGFRGANGVIIIHLK